MALLRVKRELNLDNINIGRICLPFIDIPLIQGLEVGNLTYKGKSITYRSTFFFSLKTSVLGHRF